MKIAFQVAAWLAIFILSVPQELVVGAPSKNFHPIKDVKTGRNNLAAINPFTKIYATSWDYVAGGVGPTTCTDTIVCDTLAGHINSDGIIGYYGIDFQDGARAIQMILAQWKDASSYKEDIGRIHLHLDDIHAQPFVTVIIGDTGGDENWVPVNQFIEYIPTGLHDLYFTFSTDYDSFVGNIASFTFFPV